jgi:hypothetical protein
MEPINLADVGDRHEPGEEPYHEFMREDRLSVGRYVLPAGGTDPQSPHAEDEIYHVLAGQARIRIGEDGTRSSPVTSSISSSALTTSSSTSRIGWNSSWCSRPPRERTPDRGREF